MTFSRYGNPRHLISSFAATTSPATFFLATFSRYNPRRFISSFAATTSPATFFSRDVFSLQPATFYRASPSPLLHRPRHGSRDVFSRYGNPRHLISSFAATTSPATWFSRRFRQPATLFFSRAHSGFSAPAVGHRADSPSPRRAWRRAHLAPLS